MMAQNSKCLCASWLSCRLLLASESLSLPTSSTYALSIVETMSNSANRPVTVANPPFDDPDADTILRSSDTIDFHVHKILLSLVSPVFKSMFSLPQSSPGDENNDASFKNIDGRDLPIISLAENGELLRKLLTWCDPRCIPASTAPLDIDIVIRLADKYDMDVVSSRARHLLKLKSESWSYTPPESLRTYAIACTHGFEDIARVAAKGVLRQSVEELPTVPELKNITGTALQNLYNYHFACSRATLNLRNAKLDSQLSSLIKIRSSFASSSNSCQCSRSASTSLKTWTSHYLDLVMEGISKRPCSETIVAQSPDWVQVSLVIKDMNPCSLCHPTAHLTLERYGKALAAQLDKIIDRVRDLLIHRIETSKKYVDFSYIGSLAVRCLTRRFVPGHCKDLPCNEI